MEQKISHGMDDINGNVRLGISAASFPKKEARWLDAELLKLHISFLLVAGLMTLFEKCQ